MPSRELLQAHAAQMLAKYLPSLEYVGEVHGRGYLNSADPAEVQKHLQELKQYLREKGTPEEDEYLLQFAIQIPGLQRGIQPPLAVLGPQRGGFSKARLEQAAGQLLRVREALSAGNRMLGPFPADTARACAELIATIKRYTPAKENWIELYSGLTSEEKESLIRSAIALFSPPQAVEQEVGREILSCLANFTFDGLGAYAELLLDRGLLRPATLYRGAPNRVAERLVEGVAQAREQHLTDLLLALAWTRGETAQRAFVTWRRNPQPWASRLRVPIEAFTLSAGWTLDARDNQRDLISWTRYAIVAQEGTAAADPLVLCRVPIRDHCPGCNHALAWLFDFSRIRDPFWSSDLANAPRRLLFCPACACFATVFSRYGADGTSEWHSKNELGASEGEGDWPVRVCKLLASPLPTFSGHSLPGHEESWLGGAPGWLDHAAYPACPDCGTAMRFLAQFDNATGSQPEPGIYYGFYCETCRVAAATYQQT